MVSLNDLRIDTSSLGNAMYLVEVRPVYKYNEKRERTEEVEGYSYSVICPAARGEKLTVKIEGDKQLDAPESGLMPVAFEGLEIKAYVIKGESVITAHATKIMKVKAA